MTDKVETGASALDTVKLVAAVAILVGGIAGFYLLSSYPLAVRWVIVLASFGLGVLVALQSVQGQAFWRRGRKRCRPRWWWSSRSSRWASSSGCWT
jgi:preprotein translocase subunit SecE